MGSLRESLGSLSGFFVLYNFRALRCLGFAMTLVALAKALQQRSALSARLDALKKAQAEKLKQSQAEQMPKVAKGYTATTSKSAGAERPKIKLIPKATIVYYISL